MIVDTSALVAILWNEPEAAPFSKAIINESAPKLAAANYLELGIVIDGKGDAVASARIDELLDELGIEIAPVTAIHARRARQAHRDFGKGSGHKAQLNFGDCFAYALATERGEDLLYKGDDFVHAGFSRVVGL